MIISWKHKGLKKFFETGSTSGIQTKNAARLRQQLAFLDAAEKAEDLNLPGYGFHNIKGKLKNHYAISVNGGFIKCVKF